MISTVLAMALAATTMQSDTTRSAREAYNACLRQFMQQSIPARRPAAEFETALGQQCTAQATAYRTAVLSRESSNRATRASAETTAGEEIGEARSNMLEHYRMATEPR